MLSARFEPKIPKTERPNTHAFERATAGIGFHLRVMYTHIYIYIPITYCQLSVYATDWQYILTLLY